MNMDVRCENFTTEHSNAAHTFQREARWPTSCCLPSSSPRAPGAYQAGVMNWSTKKRVLFGLCGSYKCANTRSIVLPEDLPSSHILQHITQCKKDPSHSFQLAGGRRHRVLVQDLLLDTQNHNKFSGKIHSFLRLLDGTMTKLFNYSNSAVLFCNCAIRHWIRTFTWTTNNYKAYDGFWLLQPPTIRLAANRTIGLHF